MSVETFQCQKQLNIRSITDQHQILMAKIDDCQSLLLNVPQDAEIDVSFLQLIESARLYAASLGKKFSLERPADHALLDILSRAGWLSETNREIRKFWLHEGVN
jgi:hypothetical protein